jgi:hypothetical protein
MTSYAFVLISSPGDFNQRKVTLPKEAIGTSFSKIKLECHPYVTIKILKRKLYQELLVTLFVLSSELTLPVCHLRFNSYLTAS